MNEAPKGKIGRLPRAIQEQVNLRLENGEKARTLVAWLNALPEVQAMLAAEFGGKPIREQNLSEWRKYGYKQWLWHQQALAMTQDSPGFGKPTLELRPGWTGPHSSHACLQPENPQPHRNAPLPTRPCLSNGRPCIIVQGNVV